MFTVKAPCPCCGDIELAPRDIVLVVFQPPRPGLDWYSFTCPKCREAWRKPATSAVIAELGRGGIKPQVVHIPDEIDDPARSGRPITIDDVLDFPGELAMVEELDREVWG